MLLYAYIYYLDVLAVVFVEKGSMFKSYFKKIYNFSNLPIFIDKVSGT